MRNNGYIIMSENRSVISVGQQKMIMDCLEKTRHPLRNKAMLLLTLTGLSAATISRLDWKHVTDAQGQISDRMELTTRSGNVKQVFFVGESLKNSLIDLYASTQKKNTILEQ